MKTFPRTPRIAAIALLSLGLLLLSAQPKRRSWWRTRWGAWRGRPRWRALRRLSRSRLRAWRRAGPGDWHSVLRGFVLRSALLRSTLCLLRSTLCLRSGVRLRSGLRTTAAVLAARVPSARLGTGAAGQLLLVLLPSSNGYYPYVRECPGGWQQVSPRPPGL